MNTEYGEYKKELQFALESVRLASKATSKIQKSLKNRDIEKKTDSSPVTIADYAAQAIVNKHLFQYLGSDQKMVAEEDSTNLKKSTNSELLEEVIRNVEEIIGVSDSTEILDLIDRGNHDASSDRYWTLDPVDGTKGFIRGEQYAISLALIENGEVILGVLGCPNLSSIHMETFESGKEEGTIYFSIKGKGSWSGPTHELNKKDKLKISNKIKTDDCRACESVESSHSRFSYSSRIFDKLDLSLPPLRLDSQCKYAVVARGQAEIYLRIPTDYHYEEKIWDHAAGSIIAQEAGAIVTDIKGKRLDFRAGKTLKKNQGIACAIPAIHNKLLEAIGDTL